MTDPGWLIPRGLGFGAEIATRVARLFTKEPLERRLILSVDSFLSSYLNGTPLIPANSLTTVSSRACTLLLVQAPSRLR
jgi:hypothetical protein